MPNFDRYDVCCAYAALEYDWNKGGWLQERPSSQRRKESIGVLLHRIGFQPARDEAAGFSYLIRNGGEAAANNRAEIYIGALIRFGLAGQVRADDEIAQYARENFTREWVAEHFPHIAAVHDAPRPGQ